MKSRNRKRMWQSYSSCWHRDAAFGELSKFSFLSPASVLGRSVLWRHGSAFGAHVGSAEERILALITAISSGDFFARQRFLASLRRARYARSSAGVIAASWRCSAMRRSSARDFFPFGGGGGGIFIRRTWAYNASRFTTVRLVTFLLVAGPGKTSRFIIVGLIAGACNTLRFVSTGLIVFLFVVMRALLQVCLTRRLGFAHCLQPVISRLFPSCLMALWHVCLFRRLGFAHCLQPVVVCAASRLIFLLHVCLTRRLGFSHCRQTRTLR